MNRSDTEQKSPNGAVISSSVNTHLSGSWLIIARVVWLALVVPSLGLFVASLPLYYQQLQEACVDATACALNGALPAQVLQLLPTIGFSVSGYAALVTILSVIIAAIWCGIGLLIFWRRSDDWLALLAAFVLVMYDITASGNPPYALALASPNLALLLNLMSFLAQVSLGVFFVLFPNGRLVPRWLGLILLLFIMNSFLSTFPSTTSPFNPSNWPIWLNLLVTLALYGGIIFSQIYRYRRVSTSVQRQQTKWVILGVAAAIGLIIGLLVLGSLIPSIDNTIFYNVLWYIMYPAALLLFPLSIGFSILRYRLYDIDVLINRTLVYGTLTVSLALVYFGLVIGLQTLVRLFTGDALQSPIVIVASTLAIAALFQPLRHRIQAIIDHRFYRRKYDAARTLEEFSSTLRNELELTQLSEHLLNVVQQTMQPTQVSLWLRKSDYEKKTNIQV
jgi:hypothetical protein